MKVIFLWREHHDLVIIADLLNIPIDVIITKENVVTGHVQITPSERNKSDIVKFSGGRMVLMFDSVKAHYKAVCSSDKIEKKY